MIVWNHKINKYRAIQTYVAGGNDQYHRNLTGISACLPLVVTMAFYVFPNCIGYDVADGAVLLYLVAHKSGGDVEQGGLENGHVGPMGIGDLETGPVVDNERVAGNELFVILPAVDILKAVGTHYDGKLLERKLLGEVGKRIDGVRGLWQVKLHVAGAELRVIFYGEINEMEAVIFVEQRMGLLQRIVRRHYEPNLIDLCMCNDVICYN